MSRKRPDMPKDLIEQFCRKHRIRKLSIFGSYLREDFGHESDIDFLVEFEEGHVPVFSSLLIWSRNYPSFLGAARWTFEPLMNSAGISGLK